MAESIEEQIAYGDHCMHGTAIGTPGGADLMCMDCELGYTVWVDARFFQMYVVWRSPEDIVLDVKCGPLYPEDHTDSALAHIVDYHKTYSSILSDRGWVPEYSAKLEQVGYWTTDEAAHATN